MIHEETKGIVTNLGDREHRIKGKNAFVTGGAGFLGSWLCDMLVEEDTNVRWRDNLPSGLKARISHLSAVDTFTFIQHDLADQFFFDAPLDLVMHPASQASPFEFAKLPIRIINENSLDICVAPGIAKKHGARVLYAFTSKIFNVATEIPTSKEYHCNMNSIRPRSCYDEGIVMIGKGNSVVESGVMKSNTWFVISCRGLIHMESRA
jgi:UDP-glucuronate decarboxylase